MRPFPFALFSLASSLCLGADPLPEAAPSQLPRWRGFNLLEKFYFHGHRRPFVEDDFRMISGWGFNFVRLPMDYRCYIVGGDWERFDQRVLADIDQAVEWGKKYDIHVCLNLHRAPGWTVAKPPEETDLWTDSEPRRVAALHWGMFAKRYRGVPNARLSFNLFNEPAGIEEARYVEVVEAMLQAIRAEDPDRLVLCDGREWGKEPVEAFIPLGVGMMTRGYSPFPLTHYQAGWVGGSDQWERPRWPMEAGTNGALLGPAKPEGSHPLRIEGPVAAGSTLRLVVGKLSSRATLTLTADGEEIWRRELAAREGDERWDRVAHIEKWNTWQAEGSVAFMVPVEKAARVLELRTVGGDWLALREAAIKSPNAKSEAAVSLQNRWAEPPEALHYRPAAPGGPLLGVPRDRKWLERETIEPWRAFQAAGGGVMVGEWGAHNRTPHEVVLRWAEDCLHNWREAGWGWALWNLRGSFGVLDSGRPDVEYEDYQGHMLDRKFLDLLQRY